MAIDPKYPQLGDMLGGDNPIPWEHFDNDQRFTGEPIDTSRGSIYDYLMQRDKAHRDKVKAERPR